MSGFSPLLFKSSKQAQGPNHAPLEQGGEAWSSSAGGHPASCHSLAHWRSQHLASSPGRKKWSLKGTAWVNTSCFLQAENGLVKRCGNFNSMLDSTFIQREIWYRCHVCWTPFSLLKSERSWSCRSGHKLTQEKNSTAWKFFMGFFRFDFFFFSVYFFGWLVVVSFFYCWALPLSKNIQGQPFEHTKFCHFFLPRAHLTSLSQSVEIRLQLIQSFGELG